MEFVAKRKKLKITIDDQSMTINMPTVDQAERWDEKIKAAAPGEVLSIYRDYFAELGIPREVTGAWDLDTLQDFVMFMINPKKANTASAT